MKSTAVRHNTPQTVGAAAPDASAYIYAQLYTGVSGNESCQLTLSGHAPVADINSKFAVSVRRVTGDGRRCAEAESERSGLRSRIIDQATRVEARREEVCEMQVAPRKSQPVCWSNEQQGDAGSAIPAGVARIRRRPRPRNDIANAAKESRKRLKNTDRFFVATCR